MAKQEKQLAVETNVVKKLSSSKEVEFISKEEDVFLDGLALLLYNDLIKTT